jgi:hypothetical protein
MTLDRQITAIRLAIKALEYERKDLDRRKELSDQDRFEAREDIGADIEALNAAIANLKNYDALKTILKAVTTE